MKILWIPLSALKSLLSHNLAFLLILFWMQNTSKEIGVASNMAFNVENSLGLNLSVELFVTTITHLSENSVKDAKTLTSKSWADIIEVVDESNRPLHINKIDKKTAKNNMGVRNRRGHVSNSISS